MSFYGRSRGGLHQDYSPIADCNDSETTSEEPNEYRSNVSSGHPKRRTWNEDRHGWSSFLASQEAPQPNHYDQWNDHQSSSYGQRSSGGDYMASNWSNGDAFEELCSSVTYDQRDSRQPLQYYDPESTFTEPKRRYNYKHSHRERNDSNSEVTLERNSQHYADNRSQDQCGFCIDRVGGDQGVREPLFVRSLQPVISQKDEDVNSPEKNKTVPPKRPERPKTSACFNCMETGHMLFDCPHPHDRNRIRLNRQNFLEQKSSSMNNSANRTSFERYHASQNEEGSQVGSSRRQGLHHGGISSGRRQGRYADIKPGQCSKSLRRALGINDKQLPAFIYKMRQLGYPPGWLMDCIVYRHNKDDHRRIKEEYDFDRLITFPGFNETPESRVLDESELYGAPSFSEELFGKERFIKTLLDGGCEALRYCKLPAYGDIRFEEGDLPINCDKATSVIPMDIEELDDMNEDSSGCFDDIRGEDKCLDYAAHTGDDGVAKTTFGISKRTSHLSIDDDSTMESLARTKSDPLIHSPDKKRMRTKKKSSNGKSPNKQMTVVRDTTVDLNRQTVITRIGDQRWSLPEAIETTGLPDEQSRYQSSSNTDELVNQKTVPLISLAELSSLTEECLRDSSELSVGDSIGESEGTPLVMSQDSITSTTPSIESFAAGINSHRFFENLPGCTGNYSRIMDTLRRSSNSNKRRARSSTSEIGKN